MNQRRLFYFVCAIATVAMGLASRRFGASLPEFVSAYVGDTLWAIMVLLGVSAMFPATPRMSRGMLALAFAFGIEISQLFHTPWLYAIRRTTLGGLVLGFGFLWSDLVCYTVGIGVGMVLDYCIFSHRAVLCRDRNMDCWKSSDNLRVDGERK